MSLGKPCVFHCLISNGVARILMTLKSSDTGIPSSLQCSIHWLSSYTQFEKKNYNHECIIDHVHVMMYDNNRDNLLSLCTNLWKHHSMLHRQQQWTRFRLHCWSHLQISIDVKMKLRQPLYKWQSVLCTLYMNSTQARRNKKNKKYERFYIIVLNYLDRVSPSNLFISKTSGKFGGSLKLGLGLSNVVSQLLLLIDTAVIACLEVFYLHNNIYTWHCMYLCIYGNFNFALPRSSIVM